MKGPGLFHTDQLGASMDFGRQADIVLAGAYVVHEEQSCESCDYPGRAPGESSLMTNPVVAFWEGA
jgi:hypothetical protein